MYQKSAKGWIKHADFIVIDLVCLQLAFLIAYMIRHGLQNPYVRPVYCSMAIYLLIVDIIVTLFFETMKNVLKRSYYREMAETLKQVIVIEMLSVLYLFAIQKSDVYSRSVWILTGVCYLFFTYTGRLIRKKRIKRNMTEGKERSLLVITDSHIAQEVTGNLKKENYQCYTFAGLVMIDGNHIGETVEDVAVVADMDTVVEYVLRNWIDEILIVPYRDEDVPGSVIEAFMEAGITVHLNMTNLRNFGSREQFVEHLGGYTVLTLSIKNITTRNVVMKRCMDIFGGFLGCILTGIIFLVVAPAIFLESPGPIFFTQIRIGKNGRRFKMYKFRSMYLDAEERKKELMKDNRMDNNMMFKMDFDPRVIGNKLLPDGTKKTGIGQFIRDMSIDEFPQFFNVLKGDMSLCGTRPPTVDEWNRYEPHHRVRLSIKPGITGLWQISGRSDITDFEEVVRLDTEYIENWNIGLDIKIILKTIAVVLRKDGSM